MSSVDEEIVRQAQQLQTELAGANLPPVFAKLYSQHVRLGNRMAGLSRWGMSDEAERLDDAVMLFEAGLTLRESNNISYRSCLRRAGELLEWLAHPATNTERLPLRLIAGAIYQLAGYPARSTGLLKEGGTSTPESPILLAFLRADFPVLMERLSEYWATEIVAKSENASERRDVNFDEQLQTFIVKETASCLGIFCAAMRWGDDARLASARKKIRALAGVMNYGTNPYSYLLAKLCVEVVDEYFNSSLRTKLSRYADALDSAGKLAVERYFRLAYRDRKSIAWPSQATGIDRLIQGGSFTICTPTGSGKTTIAELAILKSLFSEGSEIQEDENGEPLAPLAIYLVPSRALAAEVESKFSRVLKRLSDETVVVTGLYGGADWGPTDAWLTSQDRTILICTYEKSEALMRFLGPLFINRVRLIVLDEAHTVQFNGRKDELHEGSNRGLRLESLGMRLFSHIENRGCEVVALSAVATGIDQALAGWVSNGGTNGLIRSPYRSTRQLIGRLECSMNGTFEIHYDLLDGANLQFDTATVGLSNRPFIRSPFPPIKPLTDWSNGPYKVIRPRLLWAAMHLAAPDESNQRHGVLISLTEKISDFANDFLELIENVWSSQPLPNFFEGPQDVKRQVLWTKCLTACADYFGEKSAEYRLLRRGILLHYGRMPGLMARLLVEVIEQRIIFLAVATSTLSEGVNLPFETILIPSLNRWDGESSSRLPTSEFSNLVGRAGRPGVGTEGRSLVVLMQGSQEFAHTSMRNDYNALIRELTVQHANSLESQNADSPLARLLLEIWDKWKTLASSDDAQLFYHWLETTAPLDYPIADSQPTPGDISSLDALDAVLISALVEVDQLANDDLTNNELELRLQRIWNRSYAHFALRAETGYDTIFMRRGYGLLHNVYPDRNARRKLYRTCLLPRHGNSLLRLYPEVCNALVEGEAYSKLDHFAKLEYVIKIATLVGGIATFSYDKKASRQGVEIRDVLSWWLLPGTIRNNPRRSESRKTPNAKQVSHWVRYISSNLVYKFCWGLGSIISLSIDEMHEGKLSATKLDDWPKTGLPWITFWLKELVTWGTLDPVAAFLLSSNKSGSREEAEIASAAYYEFVADIEDPNEKLNARRIRDWASVVGDMHEDYVPPGPFEETRVVLTRDFSNQKASTWKVVPVQQGKDLLWYDPAGYPLAKSPRPETWSLSFSMDYDFILDSNSAIVRSSKFI